MKGMKPKMIEYYPEGKLISKAENKLQINSLQGLIDAQQNGNILEARAVVCDSSHNLIVELGSTRGIIPREEGAIGIREGSVRDIAIISRVNKPVCFIVKDFMKDSDGNLIPILSRRAAQEQCMQNYIDKLIPGDIINAKVTHLDSFGAFADIGCGVVSLLPIDSISVSRIDHPRERFSVGMDIRAIIKNKENGRISLSHKELLGTWKENAEQFSIGETVAGVIRSVEEYGAFVELTPNLAGLAETHANIEPGQQASVYIKNIIPSRMKIKLIIIDAFVSTRTPTPPIYFYNGNHIDHFRYSPESSLKIVETIF